MAGSEAQDAEVSTLESAMANLEVKEGVSASGEKKEAEPQEESTAITGEGDAEEIDDASVDPADKNEAGQDSERPTSVEVNSPEKAASQVKIESAALGTETCNENAETEDNADADASKDDQGEASSKVEVARNEDVELLKNATRLMEKLDIVESSDGGSNGDDDVSSSMDSTANSGPRLVEGDQDKVVSNEDCAEETTARPKKRIDLQHQFVRGIVKIQYDRDQYERQWQNKKQEEVKDPADNVKSDDGNRTPDRKTSSRGSIRSNAGHRRNEGNKRQFSYVEANSHQRASQSRTPEEGQKSERRPERSASIYRPPNLRNTEADATRSSISQQSCSPVSVRPTLPKHGTNPSAPPASTSKTDLDSLPENVGIRVTFDTEMQKRRIQLSKPTIVTGKGESNFIVTFDTTRKERHIEIPASARTADKEEHGALKNHNGKGYKDNLPASFEFKATSFGRGSIDGSSPDNVYARRSSRTNNRLRGSRAPMFEVGSTPTRDNENRTNGLLEVNTRKNEEVIPQLPPKDKPFAAETRWSDIVDSESEPSPIANFANPISNFVNDTPDVLESNQWHSPTNMRRRVTSKKPKPKKKEIASTPPAQQQESETQDTQNTQRRSVWERLGPRPSPDISRLRTLHYEAENSLESFREVSEREYFCKPGQAGFLSSQAEVASIYSEASELSSVQAAYKDTKQKRTRLELYVPRRGGTQV